jgi:hypothetical protein
VALVVGGVAFIYSRWQDAPTIGGERRPVQLRLSPSGVGQRDGIGGVSVAPWTADHRVSISKTAGGGVRIRCVRESALGFVTSVGCDFETMLSPDDVNLLQERVSRWLTAAGGLVRSFA